MWVSVIGVGAVGIGLATCLGRSGVGLHLVPRSAEQAQRLRAEGVVRTGIFGDVAIPGAELSADPRLESLGEARSDFWLVCIKSHASGSLANALGPLWHDLDAGGDAPLVVLCQNGWGNAEIFARHLPERAIFNARVITGFTQRAPNEVEITVHADAIRMGSLFGLDPTPLLPLCDAIDRGGLPCEISHEIGKDLWAKVLYNSLLNPLGALLGVSYGELGERRETRAIMAKVAEEAFAALAASGHSTHWPDAEAYLEHFYAKLLPPTERHRSSMLEDLQAGRPTEIDAICGAICALGDEYGIQTPVNRGLLSLVHAAEGRGT